MEALGSHLAGIPGRKNLVWIGAGFSMSSVTGAMGMGVHGSIETFESKVRKTSQRLAQQGIVLYIVDSEGISLPSDQTAASHAPVPVRGRGRFEPQMDSDAISNDPHPAMELMSSITGGRYIYNTNDLTAGFKQTAADVQGSYTLGFYMPGDPDDKWHKLKIRVKHSGVSVRHREGYLASLGPAQPSGLDSRHTLHAATHQPDRLHSDSAYRQMRAHRCPAIWRSLRSSPNPPLCSSAPMARISRPNVEIFILDRAARWLRTHAPRFTHRRRSRREVG